MEIPPVRCAYCIVHDVACDHVYKCPICPSWHACPPQNTKETLDNMRAKPKLGYVK